MRVEAAPSLQRQRPVAVARKFRVDVDIIERLQAGEIIEIEDIRARALKQWGMVRICPHTQTPAPTQVEQSGSDAVISPRTGKPKRKYRKRPVGKTQRKGGK